MLMAKMTRSVLSGRRADRRRNTDVRSIGKPREPHGPPAGKARPTQHEHLCRAYLHKEQLRQIYLPQPALALLDE